MLNGRKATKELLKELEQGTKPKTNADKIRAMSDEELADIMSMHTATGACNDWGIPHEKCGGNCRECIIDWLKQPAEVSE